MESEKPLLNAPVPGARLDIYLMTDQPEECRKCGARTDWADLADGSGQIHRCLNPKCGYAYILEIDEDEEEGGLYRIAPWAEGDDVAAHSAEVSAKLYNTYMEEEWGDPYDPESNIVDMVTDLLHLAKAMGYRPQTIRDRAFGHHETEQGMWGKRTKVTLAV